MVAFLGKHVTMRRGEGSLVSTGVSPHPAVLHTYVTGGRWDDAVRLCRFVKVRLLKIVVSLLSDLHWDSFNIFMCSVAEHTRLVAILEH